MNLSFHLKICLLLSLCIAGLVSAYKVTATGRILCHGTPLRHSRVVLMDEDLAADDYMGAASTDANGYFTVSGSASDVAFRRRKRRPDVYIRVDYRHNSVQALFEVDRTFLRGGKEESSTKKDRRGHVDFGTLHFNTEMCRIYQQFYDATHDFYNRVGYRVPFDLRIKAQAILHGGAPYALYDTIRIPKGLRVDFQTAQHELAHTVRHTYDGGYSHFLFDVVRFGYTRNHYCSKSTNLGFAFNEGWAEYWARDYCGTASGSKKVEGNVASALWELQKRCGTSDHNMWEVLRRNRRSIHSYYEYAEKHEALFGCSL